MRLARVAGPDGLPRLAAIGPDGAVVDLALAARRRLERRGATAEAAARLAAAWFPDRLTAALGGGERLWEEAAEALAGAGTDATLDPAGLTWLPPVDPPAMRDCLGRQLAPGDTVELEVAGIGVLRNRLSRPEPPGWRPTPRRPERQRADVGG